MLSCGVCMLFIVLYFCCIVIILLDFSEIIVLLDVDFTFCEISVLKSDTSFNTFIFDSAISFFYKHSFLFYGCK